MSETEPTFHYELVDEPPALGKVAMMCFMCTGSEHPEFPQACPCWLTNNGKTFVRVEER